MPEARHVVDVPPLRRLVPPVAVEVLHKGSWWPGFATAWRGDRVSVTWKTGVAEQHLTWEPAANVRRLPSSP